jgi:serine/threonine protein kinase
MAKLTAITNGAVIDGRYRVTSTLGEGTFGTVYEAEHLQLNRHVAIKLLRHCDPAKLERFRREAEAISRISQENVVAIHDYGELDDGRPYIVLDLIRGEDLSEILKSHGRLPARQVVDIGLGVLRALEAAHQQGIVHRDLKPSNVIIGHTSESGNGIKVVDFGLAKPLNEEGVSLTQTGDTIGTPQYMSPEQCRGLNLDGRSDIYSLGLIMFEALTGKPFVAEPTLFDCMTKHVEGQEVVFEDDGWVPNDLAAVVRKALAKDREERYQDAVTMMRALKAVRLSVKRPLIRLRESKGDTLSTRLKIGAAALVLIGAVAVAANWHGAPPPAKVDHTVSWHATHFGRLKFVAPSVASDAYANTGEFVKSYTLDANDKNYIEIKQYPDYNVIAAVKDQHGRHSQYDNYKPIKELESKRIGANKAIPSNEDSFTFGPKDHPMTERHVIFEVEGDVYKFKLHMMPADPAVNKMFDKMLASIKT